MFYRIRIVFYDPALKSAKLAKKEGSRWPETDKYVYNIVFKHKIRLAYALKRLLPSMKQLY